ncbi:MAG TPA: AAA family ATPase [Candidatus Saccharimonadales bacterium]|nr:AAA family ATPase [Candidatus Saccharimonadales bacterium]
MNIIINLFGPSAAGKSTTAHLLQEKIDNLQIVDFDVIKRQIPGYDWQVHSQKGRDMTLEVLKSESQQRLPILLLMPSARNGEEYERIQSIADTNEYQLLNIEITAPEEILIQRYKDRMQNIDPSKKGWKFKTVDEFKAKLKEVYYKPNNTVTLDTSQLAPEEIADNIFKLLN